MHQKLEEKFARLEDFTAELLTELDGLEDEQLDFKPQEDRWSIQNVLEHVLAAEVATFAYLRKKNQAADLPQSGLSESWRGIALKAILRSPLKFPAPGALKSPHRFNDMQELRNAWEKQRSALKSFLQDLPNERVDKIIFKHPIVGYFNIVQTLDFLYEHLYRHARQIRRLKKHQAFPASIA